MSRNLFASALAVLVLLWCAGLANAQQSGTAAEARAMLDRAVAALKTEFKATALSEFNDKNNKQYHDRDLYVFCLNMSDGKITAQRQCGLDGYGRPHHQSEGRLVRTKNLRRDEGDAGSKASPQWTITSRSPAQPSPFPKQSFVTRVGDQGCGVGYYK